MCGEMTGTKKQIHALLGPLFFGIFVPLPMNISGSRKGVKALPVLSPMHNMESLLSFLSCRSH